MTKIINIGAVKGRHEMPVTEFIFSDSIADPSDFVAIEKHVNNVLSDKVKSGDHITLYVTGLTVVTTAAIKFAVANQLHITLMHFDNASGTYKPQSII
ncbi:hypothetical protein JXA27_06490 [Aerococcaceae bacterium zg-B36]|uniref:hypothetical protein n=1 Tax=Aerococcaceae bacterium zg-252 TaxID=2796928 RepID=UPI001BD87D12|nr:hypothetical protein [Aerococcaceae bacterium zg-B36]